MKAFIDKVFKKRKQDVKQLEEPTRTEDKTTEAMVEAIIEEVKEVIKKEKHIDCECKECIAKVKQNAK